MKPVLVLSALAAILVIPACAPTAPPTIEQKCAMAVAQQTGKTVKDVTLKGSVPTAVGPKIYVVSGGTTYTCQGDTSGNIGAVELQG